MVWDAAFEASPPDTENVSLGATRIRVGKQDTRARGAVEMDWGTITGGADTGRLRAGAARCFYGAADPAVLTVADVVGSAALDQGRLAFNSDTKRLRLYNGAAWENVISPSPQIGVTSLDAGAVLYPAGVPTAWGGVDCSLVIPQFGTYEIEVYADLSVAAGAPSPGAAFFFTLQLDEDPGTGVYGAIEFRNVVLPQAGATPTLQLNAHTYRTGITPNVTYRYRIVGINNSGVPFNNSASNTRLTAIARRVT